MLVVFVVLAVAVMTSVCLFVTVVMVEKGVSQHQVLARCVQWHSIVS